MRSVPPRSSGGCYSVPFAVADGLDSTCASFSIFDDRADTEEWCLTVGHPLPRMVLTKLRTHPLPRGGTDLITLEAVSEVLFLGCEYRNTKLRLRCMRIIV